MKSFLKLALVLLISVVSLNVFAQSEAAKDKPKNPNALMERLTERLELSDEQQTQIKPILEKYRTEVRTLKESEMERAQKMTQMESLMAAQKQELAEFLTPIQLEKYTGMMMHRAAKAKKHHERKRPQGEKRQHRMQPASGN